MSLRINNKFIQQETCGSLFQPQKPLYKVEVSLADFAFFGHNTLALLGFLGEDMTFERFLEGDLPGAGYLKPLFCTRIGSNLWHFNAFCMLPCWRIRTGESLMEPFGLLGAQRYKKKPQSVAFF